MVKPQRRGMGAWVALTAALATALLVRALIFLYASPRPQKLYTPDSFGYDQIALNLLQYGMFSSQTQPPLSPDLKRTPGYPGLMAAIYAVTGHSPEAVILVQLILAAATVVLVYLLARELGVSGWAARLAAFVVALEPVSGMTSSLLLSETLFTFLLVASMLLVVSAWRRGRVAPLLAAAALLGAASLTRPVAQFLPLGLAPVVAFALIRRGVGRPLVAVLIFLLVSLGITFSWAYHNYQISGQLALSSVTDVNLLYYRAREVLADAKGISQEEARRELEARVGRAGSVAERSGAERRQAISIFLAHPVQTASMMGKGAVRIFADPGFTMACTLLDRESSSMECLSGEASMNESGALGSALGVLARMNALQLLVLGWSALLSAVVYLTAAVGAAFLVRDRRWFPLALLLVVAGYFVLVSIGAEAYSRFRIPVMPVLAILGAVAVGRVLERRTSGESSAALQG